jgi:hypothetical protein
MSIWELKNCNLVFTTFWCPISWEEEQMIQIFEPVSRLGWLEHVYSQEQAPRWRGDLATNY